jgi:hypothetical protein
MTISIEDNIPTSLSPTDIGRSGSIFVCVVIYANFNVLSDQSRDPNPNRYLLILLVRVWRSIDQLYVTVIYIVY